MKWKIILRFEMERARNSPRGDKKTRYALGTKAIVPLLKELGLEKSWSGTWSSDGVIMELAAEKLPKLLDILSRPRSVENTTGKLKCLFLYIESVGVS